jgi:hypothetical protein
MNSVICLFVKEECSEDSSLLYNIDILLIHLHDSPFMRI